MYSIFTQITLLNILSYHILFLQILFLGPVYSLKYYSLAQIIDDNILTQLMYSIFTHDYTIEYSVLPHIIPSNIIPLPRLLARIFRLSSVYSIITQIKLWNILFYPILFLQILFLSPDYWREYSVLAQYIQSSPKLY